MALPPPMHGWPLAQRITPKLHKKCTSAPPRYRAAWQGRSPAAYRWSGHPCNAYGVDDPLVAPHAEYLALGRDSAHRHAAYRDLFAQAIPDERTTEIRAYLQQPRVLGSERFQAQIETMLGRRAALRPRGRPRKQSGSGSGSGGI